MAEPTPERSIEALLQYIGVHLQSERVYIFEENEEGSLDNTYEWCKAGVEPQVDNLQKVPFEVVSLWYDTFNKNSNVIIKDLEESRDSDPLAYEYLEPQNIHSLVVNPIMNNERVIGFYGVDNPPRELLNHISTLFWIVGHFIGSLLKRRDLVKRLENLSMNDQMTQVGNRHAMHEYQKNIRIGEKLGISKDVIDKKIAALKIDMVEQDARMALGFVWEESYNGDYDEILAKADNIMYEDKRRHYEAMHIANATHSLSHG